MRKLVIPFICLVICVIAKPTIAKNVELTIEETVALKEAYKTYEKGNIDKALQIITKLNKPNSLEVAVLQGLIFLHQYKFEDALKVSNTMKSVVGEDTSKYFYKENDKVMYGFIPFDYISGIANFKVGNYRESLKDLLEYKKLGPEKVDGDIIYIIAVCYLKVGDNSSALQYLILAADQHEEGDTKDEIIYNIAALYALKNNVSESIKWLKIPLVHNKKLWSYQVCNDKDFDPIREDKAFVQFMSTYLNP